MAHDLGCSSDILSAGQRCQTSGRDVVPARTKSRRVGCDGIDSVCCCHSEISFEYRERRSTQYNTPKRSE